MISAARLAFHAFMSRTENLIRRAIAAGAAAEQPAAGPGEPEFTVEGDKAEVRLYGEVINQFFAGWYYTGEAFSDVGFLRVLDKLKGKDITLRINSYGGDVFAGVAIANYVRERQLRVQVDGLAASIASVIAAASPHVQMLSGAVLMLHNPWSMVAGNAQAMRAEAAVLDKLREAMVDIYMGKAASPGRDGWKSILDGKDGADGTWWDGHEALAVGFADEYEAADTQELPEPKKAALLEDRRRAAAVNGVTLPKNLEELCVHAAPQNPVLSKDGPDTQMAPSVRVSHRAGAFYVRR